MCGIVYCKDYRGKSVLNRARRRFKAQRHRGTEGFGYYLPRTNRLSHSPDESVLLRDLMDQANRLSAEDTSEVLFHHRFPTSTANVRNACHPFSTRWEGFKKNYVLVHNGYLFNDASLKRSHYDRGIRYVSEQSDGRFNDSEALLYDIALYLEGYQTELKAEGAIAFVMIEREGDTPTRLLFGRNDSSPLIINYKPGKLMNLASEGQGRAVEPNELNVYDYASGFLLKPEPLTIPDGYYARTYVAPGKSLAMADNDWGVEYDYYEQGTNDHYVYLSGVTDKILCHSGGRDKCPFRSTPAKPQHLDGITARPSTAVYDDAWERVEGYLTELGYDTNRATDTIVDRLQEARESRSLVLEDMVLADERASASDYLELEDELLWWEDEIEVLKLSLELVQYGLEEAEYAVA